MSEHRDTFSELVRRIDLGELVERYAGPGRRTGTTTLYCCPGPDHPDRHPSFTVTTGPTGQRWKCWSQCGRGGDAIDLVAWLERLELGDAAAWLRRWLGDPEASRPAHAITQKRRTPPAPVPLPDTERPPAEAARRHLADYLHGRNWPPHVAELGGLEVVLTRGGRPAIRYPFYSVTDRGEVVLISWQDRLLHYDPERDRAKWLAPAGRPLPMWNVPALEAQGLAAVVVAEGPADGLTAAAALLHRPDVAVVAIAGSQGWRSEWTLLLAGLRVVLATDADTAGEHLAGRIADDLDGIARVSLCVLPADINDLGALCIAGGLEAVRELLEAYLPPPPTHHSGSEHTLEHDLEHDLEHTLEELHLPGEWHNTATAYTGPICPACELPTAHGNLCAACELAGNAGPHPWRICPACHRLALTPAGRRCLLTPGCDGKYQAHNLEEAA